MNLFETQEMLTLAVKNDITFNEDVVSLLSGNMTYSIDQNEVDSQETYPIFIMHKNANISDNDQGNHMILQFILADILGDPIKSSDEIAYYPSVKNIETLSIDAMNIITQAICANSDYSVAQTNNLITTIGEADDVQSIMSFRLEKLNFI